MFAKYHFKLYVQSKLRRETTTKEVISFEKTQHENENKILKEKFEKILKDLTNFMVGENNLDKLVGVQSNLYDRDGLGFNKNPKRVF